MKYDSKIYIGKIEGEYYDGLLNDYYKYKRFHELPESKFTRINSLWLNIYELGFKIPLVFRFVNIFIDTQTFDKITKDKSAKESNIWISN